MRDLYIELLRAVLSEFEAEGLTLESLWAPAEEAGAAFLNGGSAYGIARLRYHEEICFYRFPLPTPRGTFVLRGSAWSPTWRALLGSDAEHPPGAWQVVPAELARVRGELRRVLRPARPPRPESRRPRSEPRLVALEIEARLNLTGYRHLHGLDQTNPLSELAETRKIIIPAPGDDWEWRTVRDVDRGRLCPLETPEGTPIGLRRFLARDAAFVRDDDDARVGVEPTEPSIGPETPGGFLGLSASLVPFLQHSDAVRVMMGAKNWKQALPLARPDTPLVKTGWERRVAERSGRIVAATTSGVVREIRRAEDAGDGGAPLSSATEIVITQADGRDIPHAVEPEHATATGCVAGHRPRVGEGEAVSEGGALADWPGIVAGELAVGVNALVAYVPFFGYTFEDGIVVGASFAQRLTSRHLYAFTLPLGPGEHLTASGSRASESHELVDPGIVRTGVAVTAGALLARKRAAGGRWADLRYDKPFPGTVVRSVVRPHEAEIWVEAVRPLEVGDKLTGRHGNKGVVSLILPDDEMPFFELEGTAYRVDVVLSPMGVISRMNLGQLLETHYSWLVRHGRFPPTVGEPFAPVALADLRAGLAAVGLAEGKADLLLRRDGAAQSLGRVVVGYQYLAKLNHLARDKFHVRTGGGGERYAMVTDQPVKGKRLGGGQRLGEMEVWALLAHGAIPLLEELLTAKSDDPLARKILELGFQPRAAFPVSQAAAGFPETLHALRAYFRALAFELEFLDDAGGAQERVASVTQIRLRPAGEADVRRWSRGEVRKLEDLRAEVIFGATREEQRLAMGHIALPLPLPHPLLSPVEVPRPRRGANGEPAEAEASFLSHWLAAYTGWKATGTADALQSLPVIPWAFRHDAEEGVSHLNRLYAEVIVRVAELRARVRRAGGAAVDPRAAPEVGWALYAVYRAVRRLFLTGRTTPRVYSLLQHVDGKFGILRRGLLGKRQDFSARAVIVPDPALGVDECGLPFAMMTQLLRPALTGRLEVGGQTRAAAEGLLARALASPGAERLEVRTALTDLLREHDLRVILNRQPSLHRHNILAFRPRLRDDYVIGIPPLVCAGFNADFDGDTMAVYLPLTEAGQAEAARLAPSRNAFKVSNGETILHLGQDFALGAWLLSEEPEGRAVLEGILGGQVSAALDKTSLTARVATLLERAPARAGDALARLQAAAFRAASTGQASFSIFDIDALTLAADERRLLIEALTTAPSIGEIAGGAKARGGNDEAARGRAAAEAESRLRRIEGAVTSRLEACAENPVARYVRSGARGDLAQLRQLVGCVGYVFDEHGPVDRLITGNFLTGIDADDYYALCRGARRTLLDKKLGVAEAGALTRDLVEGAYELRITTEDCGTAEGITIDPETLREQYDVLRGALTGRVPAGGRTPLAPADLAAGRRSIRVRSPLTCAAADGICRTCYGFTPATRTWPALEDMIGLLAAQSLGERGTQLSLNTFHAGVQALPIGEIRRLFARGMLSAGPGNPARRIADIYAVAGPQGLFDAVMPVIARTYGRAVAPIHVEVLLRAMVADERRPATAPLADPSAHVVRAVLREGPRVRGLPERARDWRRRGVLAALSYRCDPRLLQEIAADTAAADSLVSPKTHVMLATWRPRGQRPAPPSGGRSDGV